MILGSFVTAHFFGNIVAFFLGDMFAFFVWYMFALVFGLIRSMMPITIRGVLLMANFLVFSMTLFLILGFTFFFMYSFTVGWIGMGTAVGWTRMGTTVGWTGMWIFVGWTGMRISSWSITIFSRFWLSRSFASMNSRMCFGYNRSYDDSKDNLKKLPKLCCRIWMQKNKRSERENYLSIWWYVCSISLVSG